MEDIEEEKNIQMDEKKMIKVVSPFEKNGQFYLTEIIL